MNIASRTSETMIAAAMREAIKKVLKSANTTLMEPMMKLTIHAEPEVVGGLISDLTVNRRGEILRSQSFTSLMVDLPQDINRVFSFSRCPNGTFP